MIGPATAGPSGVPPETAELVAHLKSRRTEYAGCLRRFAYVAEATAATPSLPPPSGSVRFGAPSAAGVSADRVLEVVAALEERFLSCYAMGLQRNPKLSGRVGLSFAFVDASGEPFSVRNGGSDLSDGGVIECVVIAAHDVRLPAGAKGSAVVPMVFLP